MEQKPNIFRQNCRKHVVSFPTSSLRIQNTTLLILVTSLTYDEETLKGHTTAAQWEGRLTICQPN